MIDLPESGGRPLLLAIAGPNGAGKSTFYESHLTGLALPFVNADVIAREFETDAYSAAAVAAAVRRELLDHQQSFVFETVFSDTVGDKLALLKDAENRGYQVVLCFIGISDSDVSESRVAMRVTQGGHDVPTAKLQSRYPRTMQNLRRAIRELPHVLIFDNDDLSSPYRLTAVFERGTRVTDTAIPDWLHAAVS